MEHERPFITSLVVKFLFETTWNDDVHYYTICNDQPTISLIRVLFPEKKRNADS